MPRERVTAPHRLLPVAVIALLAVVALAAANGPGWYQRLYHPLRFEADIAANAKSNGLDPYLVAAVINVESGFDPSDVSSRGAVGLMQVLPATAAEVARETGIEGQMTAESLKVPAVNIRVGTRYLGSLLRRYGTAEKALAAYNAGSVAAQRWDARAKRDGTSFLQAVDYPATRHYIEEVLSQRDTYAGLYPAAFREAE